MAFDAGSRLRRIHGHKNDAKEESAEL